MFHVEFHLTFFSKILAKEMLFQTVVSYFTPISPNEWKLIKKIFRRDMGAVHK